jgi:predicted enzyme related to lactoylglutathione lyase
MLKLNTVIIGSENPKGLSAFYGEVLQHKAGWEGGDYVGYDAGGSYLMIGPHDKVIGKNPSPERVIINFQTSDVDGDFARIKSITGAIVVQEPYHPGEDSAMTLATFADPDGNYFQLASPMN